MNEQDRIREFDTANAFVTAAKDAASMALVDLETHKGLVNSARDHLRALEELLRKKEDHVRHLQNQEKNAEAKLKAVEKHFEVIDVDEDAENTPPTHSNATNNVRCDNGASNAIEVGSFDDSSVVSSEEEQSMNNFSFEEIIVEGCGEFGANGSYKFIYISDDGNQRAYFKAGVFRGKDVHFWFFHDNYLLWDLSVAYQDGSRILEHKLYTSMDERNLWVDFALCDTSRSVAGPCPEITGY